MYSGVRVQFRQRSRGGRYRRVQEVSWITGPGVRDWCRRQQSEKASWRR